MKYVVRLIVREVTQDPHTEEVVFFHTFEKETSSSLENLIATLQESHQDMILNLQPSKQDDNQNSTDGPGESNPA